MGVLWKIAYRNLREHKTKTLIIGSIISLGMLVLVVGNSVLDTATAGMQSNYTENYTGDLIIADSAVDAPGLTMDAVIRSETVIPRIDDYEGLIAYLESRPEVTHINPVITGVASAQIAGEGFGLMQFYGVDSEAYLDFFPENVTMIEGSFLKPDQPGVVLATAVRDMLEETAAREIGVGDRILLTGRNQTTGTRIRELEIVGVYEFAHQSAPLQMVCFVDANNARILNGLTRATQHGDTVPGSSREDTGMNESMDEGSLFGGGLVSEIEPESKQIDFDSILGDTSKRTALSAVDETAWHYVLVKLDYPNRLSRLVRDLNRAFDESDADLTAFAWIDGAGTAAELTYGLKTVFNFLILLVAVVAVIIIMNTLVISVTERIPEIGTMRAIGAQKPFVRRMIVLETLMIAVVFGSIGIIAGVAVTAILGMVGIESSNRMLQVFMGGPVLNPVVSGASVLLSLASVTTAGLLASLYPAAIALGISPVVAMSQK